MATYTSNKKTPRPYITTVNLQRIPLGFAARRSMGRFHVGGTWVYAEHTVGGVTRKSHYLTGETWHVENAITFRVRPWLGYPGSPCRIVVQDQFPLKIPSSINNANGAPARTAFAAAVANWQSVLTENEKIEYNRRVTHGMQMSGYNLYIKEYVEANA